MSNVPIINKKKSSKMEIAEIKNSFFTAKKEIRYNIIYYKNVIPAIPLISIIPYEVGDKVIVLFEDSNIENVPLIIGKFNQKNVLKQNSIASIEEIKPEKNEKAITYETEHSYIKLDSDKKKITISNKNTNKGQIIIDNDQVLIGGTDVNQFMEKMGNTITESLNNKTISSKRDIIFESRNGKFLSSSQETFFNSHNFVIRNKNDMFLQTSHINISTNFFEAIVITPKGYSLKEKNAFSFFAVDGNYTISLGKGNFFLKSINPASEFNFFIAPQSLKSKVTESIAGFSITKTKTTISHSKGATTMEISDSSFKTKLLKGVSSMFLNNSSFEVENSSGKVKMELGPDSFKVQIAGNSMELTSSGLTIKTGDIEATAGDVMALGGSYSLQKHKHPTAVPGGPSPPIPG